MNKYSTDTINVARRLFDYHLVSNDIGSLKEQFFILGRTVGKSNMLSDMIEENSKNNNATTTITGPRFSCGPSSINNLFKDSTNTFYTLKLSKEPKMYKIKFHYTNGQTYTARNVVENSKYITDIFTYTQEKSVKQISKKIQTTISTQDIRLIEVLEPNERLLMLNPRIQSKVVVEVSKGPVKTPKTKSRDEKSKEKLEKQLAKLQTKLLSMEKPSIPSEINTKIGVKLRGRSNLTWPIDESGLVGDGFNEINTNQNEAINKSS